MRPVLNFHIYSVSKEESAEPFKLIVNYFQESDDLYATCKSEKLDLGEGVTYDILSKYSPSNNGFSLELSNEEGVLLRVGCVAVSVIGMGATATSVGKHIEAVFQVEE